MSRDDLRPGPSFPYRRGSTITILNILLLVACTVQPNVKYKVDPDCDMAGLTKFHLVDSLILLSEEKSQPPSPSVGKNSKASLEKIVTSVIPQEADDHLYAIVPQSQYWGLVTTHLAATFYDNTRLVNKLGVEVIDNRVKVIETVGAIAVVAAMVLLNENIDTLSVPIVINPREGKNDEWLPLPRNPAWAYRLRTTKEDIDAVPRDTFFAEHDFTKTEKEATATFPVSTCKTATLEISQFSAAARLSLGAKRSKADLLALARKEAGNLTNSWEKKLTFLLKLPDPSRVRLFQLPPKGDITTHTLCGANTSTQSASTANALDLIGSLMKQVQAILEAQKAKDQAEQSGS